MPDGYTSRRYEECGAGEYTYGSHGSTVQIGLFWVDPHCVWGGGGASTTPVPIVVTLSATSATVATGTTLSLTATVTGSTNQTPASKGDP